MVCLSVVYLTMPSAAQTTNMIWSSNHGLILLKQGDGQYLLLIPLNLKTMIRTSFESEIFTVAKM
jgi:hypothetical protein